MMKASNQHKPRPSILKKPSIKPPVADLDKETEPVSEDDDCSDSSSSSGSCSSGEDSEDDIGFIKDLNREKNGRPNDRNQVVGEDELDGESDEDGEAQRSEKTKKRKRRATSPTSFGLMLSQALEASEKSGAAGPSTSLNQASRSANRLAKQQALLEAKRKQSAAARHERQERGHVKDVIGGWTPRPAVPFSEWLVQDQRKCRDQGMYVGGASQEKSLRRLAQTGVVKLFNAIRAAQNVDVDVTDVVPTTLSGAQKRKLNKLAGGGPAKKPRTAAEAEAAQRPEDKLTTVRSMPNVLGSRGKDEALANLSKASFLELIKSGGRQPVH